MRPLLLSAAVASLLLTGCAQAVELVTGEPAPPTASTIEDLVREHLASGGHSPQPFFQNEKAALMKFKLIDLSQVTPSRWNAEAELTIDYGPRPASVVGFQQVRTGRYELVVSRQDEQLVLMRFSQLGTVRTLPAAVSH